MRCNCFLALGQRADMKIIFSILFLLFANSALAQRSPVLAGSCGWHQKSQEAVWRQCQDTALQRIVLNNGSLAYIKEANHPHPDVFLPLISIYYCSANNYFDGSLCVPIPNCEGETEWDSDLKTCKSPDVDPCEMLESACAGSQNFSVNFQLGGKKTGVSFVCMNPLVIGDDGSFPGCTRGCLGIVGGFTSAFQSDGGEWVTQGTAKFTGSTCDPSVINDLNSQADPEYEPEDEPNLTEKPDCPNGFKGTVNGVSVCVPPKASEGLLEKEEKDNGDGTKTEKETKVKCENGVCEITTTTITKDTTSNTVVSSSSATTTVEKGKFCADNPTASACKDDSNSEEKKGSFSGSCQVGFECDGDAAMCAIAIEQHKRACETLEPAKEGIWKDIEAGTDSGSAEAMKREAQTINISTSLNTSGYGLPRSCPADPVIELPFVSKTFSIPFSKACPILKTMSDVALLITALGLLVWLVAPKGKAE